MESTGIYAPPAPNKGFVNERGITLQLLPEGASDASSRCHFKIAMQQSPLYCQGRCFLLLLSDRNVKNEERRFAHLSVAEKLKNPPRISTRCLSRHLHMNV